LDTGESRIKNQESTERPPRRFLSILYSLFLILLLWGCSKPPPPPASAKASAGGAPAVTPVSRAVDYLMSRCREGLWTSTTETTKALESGQALTPFVLYALSHAPAEILARHRAAIDRALDRLPIGGNEYPSYSLALSILALQRLRPSKDVRDLVQELKSKQLTEALGWSESDPEYGGWDEGVIPAKKPQCHRPNISVTAFACEAIGGDEKAKAFARKCRASDGGFLFTPSALWAHQNKWGKFGYATATYDGLRILPESAPDVLRIRDLPSWLTLPEEWGRSMAFYHAFTEAKVSPSPSIAKMLLGLQRSDGSWVNTSPMMKEDEPLVATGLALVAICLCR
jgi:hypothetical protein